ncbi:MAG: hypothetical protein KatS3mg087_1094 [Patescibacteria group bacterium]|nr:MAG: hypothetical protein KatS3mg087_1094 [Patescibacteria group bacterium]
MNKFTEPIELQVIPVNGVKAPSWGKLVYFQARPDQETTVYNCPECSKSTHTRGSRCKLCGGRKHGRFVQGFRGKVTPDRVKEAQQFLEALSGAPGLEVKKRVKLMETGGGLTNTGDAVVCCGPYGQRLFSVGGFPYCGNPHAIFYVTNALTIAYAHARRVGSGVIYYVEVPQDDWRVIERPLWKFQVGDQVDGEQVFEAIKEIPEGLQPPLRAVRAAIGKANHYHCRDSHYSVGTVAQGWIDPKSEHGESS